MQLMKRRLDGIYIRVTNGETGERESRCLTDCTAEQREEWLQSLNKEELIQVVQYLAERLRDIGDEYNLSFGFSND